MALFVYDPWPVVVQRANVSSTIPIHLSSNPCPSPPVFTSLLRSLPVTGFSSFRFISSRDSTGSHVRGRWKATVQINPLEIVAWTRRNMLASSETHTHTHAPPLEFNANFLQNVCRAFDSIRDSTYSLFISTINGQKIVFVIEGSWRED